MAPCRGDFLTIAAGAAFSVAAFLLAFLGVSPTAVFATAARLDRVKVSIVQIHGVPGVPLVLGVQDVADASLRSACKVNSTDVRVNSGQVPCAGSCSTFGAV